MSRWLCAALVAGLAAASPLWAQTLDPTQQRRYQDLINQLRCLVCQNQSIAESNADLANDLREQVRLQIEAGRRDEEIIDYMTARYGDYVLYRPPLKWKTSALWFGPFVILLAAIVVALRTVRRAPPAPANPAPEAERLRALLEEDKESGGP